MLDPRSSDRVKRGTRHPNAKLSKIQVRAARALDRQGMSLRQIIRKLDLPISPQRLNQCVRGESYQDVSDEERLSCLPLKLSRSVTDDCCSGVG